MRAPLLKGLAALALLATAPNCARPGLDVTGAGTGGGEGEEADATDLLNKAVVVGQCRAADALPDLAGVWAFRFETRSEVSGGSLPDPIEETVTRYGIAQFCQDGQALQAGLVVCDLNQTPIYDDSLDCAAQVPSVATLAALEPGTLSGTLSSNGPEAELELGGWRESWGLEAGSGLPPEASGVEVNDESVLIDQDGDDEIGVTLTSDGEVPITSWAARITAAGFRLTQVTDTAMGGQTESSTVQSILGGPGTRALRGRQRAPLKGTALFVRVDGRFASPSIDANGDGAITCAEVAPLIGNVLPIPREAGCRR